MSRRLEVFAEYRYGKRAVLKAGDRFRVRGGPVYLTAEGKKIAMGERGVFVFKRYCVRGAARWIEASRADGGGMVVLWVGKPCRSPVAANLRRRPYRLTKLLDRKPANRNA